MPTRRRDLETLIGEFERAYGKFKVVVYPSPGDRKFEITLNGVSARGQLLDQAAPKTCAALWSCLPLKRQVIHASWSGEMCRCLEDVDLPVAEYENAMGHCSPGNLTYDPRLKELGWAYGVNEFRLPQGPLSISICGMITENLEGFAKMCLRTKLEGVLQMEMRKAK